MSKKAIKYISFMLIVCMIVPQTGWGKNDPIRNVSTTADDRMIEIRYDLITEQENGKYTVSIEISDDGGLTYNVVPHMIVGDIGQDITPGRNKRIIWMIERDFVGDIDLDRYAFRINAKRQGFNWNIFYVVLGAVVAGGSTAYLLLGGDDNDEGFPQPPGRPE